MTTLGKENDVTKRRGECSLYEARKIVEKLAANHCRPATFLRALGEELVRVRMWCPHCLCVIPEWAVTIDARHDEHDGGCGHNITED